MTQTFRYLDRDLAVAIAKEHANVSDSPESDAQSFDDEIAALREEIQATRRQLARTEAELDRIALAGHVQQ